MTKENSMGSEVVNGFKCKPKHFDKDKPVMFFAIQLFICSGERCSQGQTNHLADKIRELILELGLNKGKNRVKVTRTLCNGACRFKNYAYLYQNPQADNFHKETAYSAWKEVDTWNTKQWTELLLSTLAGKTPDSLIQFKVESKIYEE